jgi:hypothetical protein
MNRKLNPKTTTSTPAPSRLNRIGNGGGAIGMFSKIDHAAFITTTDVYAAAIYGKRNPPVPHCGQKPFLPHTIVTTTKNMANFKRYGRKQRQFFVDVYAARAILLFPKFRGNAALTFKRSLESDAESVAELFTFLRE